jgi:hypothetical protein
MKETDCDVVCVLHKAKRQGQNENIRNAMWSSCLRLSQTLNCISEDCPTLHISKIGTQMQVTMLLPLLYLHFLNTSILRNLIVWYKKACCLKITINISRFATFSRSYQANLPLKNYKLIISYVAYRRISDTMYVKSYVPVNIKRF